MAKLKYIDLFAGLGGFHRALDALGHECVFASEVDDELRRVYVQNFPEMAGKIFGDIRKSKESIPQHDVLCAGFPCQPFSKSGGQLGTDDTTRGTLFHEIVEVLRRHRPRYFVLENVGNFERHDRGNTWKVVKTSLLKLGYEVRGTEHVTPLPKTDWRDRSANGRQVDYRANSNHQTRHSVDDSRIASSSPKGHGLISPHHLGYPQTRERFFVVGSLSALPDDPFPQADRMQETSLSSIIQANGDLSATDREETMLNDQQIRCIEHWNVLLSAIPSSVELPSFPIWGDEIGAKYPYQGRTPWATQPRELRRCIVRHRFPLWTRKAKLLAALPSYAREETQRFRDWKVRYIYQNRTWFHLIMPYFPDSWVKELMRFPSSLRKLEWNVKGGERDLWKHVLQFRPSGLRAKRYTSCPALVAMTATQIPILGPERRFLTRTEGLRLQQFPDHHLLPASRTAAFAALGNAVHVGVVREIATGLLGRAIRLRRVQIAARSQVTRMAMPRGEQYGHG